MSLSIDLHRMQLRMEDFLPPHKFLPLRKFQIDYSYWISRSIDVGMITRSPNHEIRAPTRCFVRVGGSCGSVPIRSNKCLRNRRFDLENRAPKLPGNVPGAPGRAKSSEKTQPERHRTTGRIFFLPVERAWCGAERRTQNAAQRGHAQGGPPRPSMRIVKWI